MNKSPLVSNHKSANCMDDLVIVIIILYPWVPELFTNYQYFDTHCV